MTIHEYERYEREATVPRSHSFRIVIVCALLVVALLVISTKQCGAEEKKTPKLFTATALSLAGLAVVDAKQSIPCLKSATCAEANPLYAHGNAATFAAIKVGAIGGSIWWSWQARKQHPRLAWAMLGGLTALQGLAVVHNAQVLR